MEFQYILIIVCLGWIIGLLHEIKNYFIASNRLLNDARIELMRISGNELPKTYNKEAVEEWLAKNP
jgi:hypothetical protein